MQILEVYWIACGSNTSKAELTHLWCGYTIASITAGGLFSPEPLCTPEMLVDMENRTCVAVYHKENWGG